MKLVKIGAMWCSACLVMNPIFKKIENKYPKLVSENYDYDFDEEIIKSWNVGTVLPVLILIDNLGNEINRLTGEKTEKEVMEFLNENTI